MFTDITVSIDLNNKFNNYLRESNDEIGINLSIKVLQAGAWPLGPTQAVIPFAVPQEFEKSIRLVFILFCQIIIYHLFIVLIFNLFFSLRNSITLTLVDVS